MFLTVHLTPAAAAALRQTRRARRAGLRKTLSDLGVDLKPLHPGTTNPDLAGQFYADVDDAVADSVRDRLLKHPAVVAAYAKPAGEPPAAGTP